ncbi:MAG: ABC transporter permease [Spirochaetes bacterium]|nr:MAG: ABC transporter permease [Spirochaetota bacterium]RKX78833.1 MAG: ABC transporter permease [Spirochaetota bacterium]RKX98550.1 MAG: ABC transporter permease [Spirochaetota bacterium]
MIEGIFVEGLIYSIMALGVFMTFRILDFPDLTVDGSFPLGAAVMATSLVGGLPVWTGILLALLAGAVAGTITAVIHNELKVPSLLAGILTMTMLYSINIRVLGNKANISLLKQSHMISALVDATESFMNAGVAQLVLFALIAALAVILLNAFFHTDLGLTLGALGGNERMVVAQGSNPKVLKIIGVGVSNSLVALSGAFAAQYQGFADASLGVGMVVSGLAMVMIGEFLIRSSKIHWLLIRVIAGAVVYKAIMFGGRYYGYRIHLTPNDLKLVTGLLIILSLIITKTDLLSRWKKRHQND